MSPHIRQATIEDLLSIQTLNEQLFSFETQFDDTYNQHWMYETHGVNYFTRLLTNTDNNSLCFIALNDDDVVVGYVCGYIDTYSARSCNPIAEIENMFVSELFRRQGIGQKLIDTFKSELVKQNVIRLKVAALSSNIEAIKFYQKQGLKLHESVLEMSVSNI